MSYIPLKIKLNNKTIKKPKQKIFKKLFEKKKE
jgi:DNA-binding NarL/FixJ family response regulator